MTTHAWGPTLVGHGVMQCMYCNMTMVEAAAIGTMNVCRKAPLFEFTHEQRAEIARIVQMVADEGLDHPRNLDAALDAIQCALQEDDNGTQAPT